MENFYSMCTIITKYPQYNFNDLDYDGKIYSNIDVNAYENFEFNNLKEYSECYAENEEGQENNINFEIVSKTINTPKEKELNIILLQPEDKKLILQNNVLQSTTRSTTKTNIIKKIDLNISQNNKIQELDLQFLNKKTKKSNEQNDKGHKRFNLLTRFKTHLFTNIQTNLVNKLMQESEFCKIGKKHLNGIATDIFIISKASENIDLFESTLKEVYSKNDKYNEEVITSIINANDSPLVNVFTEKIHNLKDIFIGKRKPKENYYFDFINSYKVLINKLRIKKNPKYVEDFEYYAQNIIEEYNNINLHSRPKRSHKTE